MLLVHGWEGRGAQLAPFIEPLVEHGLRVVAFDAPAHGDSPGARTTFTEIAAAIEAAGDALGSLHAVVAHSMGGATTARVASRRPLARRYVAIAPPRRFHEARRRHAERVIEAGHEARVGLVREPEPAREPLGEIEVPFDRGARFAASWPGAALHRTEGLGHRRILKDPEVVRIVHRFVAYGRAP